MSTCLLDLDDRIITDTGAMVAKHELLVQLALDNEPFNHLPTVSHDDIYRYHVVHHSVNKSKQWTPDNDISGPSEKTFDWILPNRYKRLDVETHCYNKLIELNLLDDTYVNRLTDELIAAMNKEMTSFIQCLIWITDTMRENNIVWGLGRGSSCASLIMYIIGVNKVDPVKYNIDMGEFYK